MTDVKASADDPADVLARTLYGEAREMGESVMRAVASVVLNRVRVSAALGGRHWWGATIGEVCLKPGQIKCWSPASPMRAAMLAVNSDDPDFALALHVAEDALADHIPDPTYGATFYRPVDEPWPYTLGRPREPLTTIGPFEFHDLRTLRD